MLTVICVLSEGPGDYDRSHVERLRQMVAQHLTIPHEFTCLDDSPWPGWWAKVSLFEPGRLRGRVLYLDLDVTVVDSLDDLVTFPQPFGIIRDWNRPGFNSSVMVWSAGAGGIIYTRFKPEHMEKYVGDQDWIYRRIPFAKTFPKGWCVSYKKHVQPTGRVPEDARVVVYHGKAKPWEVNHA